MTTARDDLYAVLALLADLDRVLNPLASDEQGEFSSTPAIPPPLPPASPGPAAGAAGGAGPTPRRHAGAGREVHMREGAGAAARGGRLPSSIGSLLELPRVRQPGVEPSSLRAPPFTGVARPALAPPVERRRAPPSAEGRPLRGREHGLRRNEDAPARAAIARASATSGAAPAIASTPGHPRATDSASMPMTDAMPPRRAPRVRVTAARAAQPGSPRADKPFAGLPRPGHAATLLPPRAVAPGGAAAFACERAAPAAARRGIESVRAEALQAEGGPAPRRTRDADSILPRAAKSARASARGHAAPTQRTGRSRPAQMDLDRADTAFRGDSRRSPGAAFPGHAGLHGALPLEPELLERRPLDDEPLEAVDSPLETAAVARVRVALLRGGRLRLSADALALVRAEQRLMPRWARRQGRRW
jgi:hypothetical protein